MGRGKGFLRWFSTHAFNIPSHNFKAAAAVLQENNRLSLQVKYLQRQCALYQEAEKCYINGKCHAQ